MRSVTTKTPSAAGSGVSAASFQISVSLSPKSPLRAGIRRIRRGERIDHYETVRLRKDGSLVDISLSVSPVKDGHGNIIGASKIARDITERRQAQARQEMLTRELHHRTKNIFAVVQAVVLRSFAGKQTVKDAQTTAMNRLQSLANTHALLIDKAWHGADIGDVNSGWQGFDEVLPDSLVLTAGH